MSLLACVAYITDIIMATTYFYLKYKKRKYIFSYNNISLFTYLFAILVAPLMYSLDKAWYALGVTQASQYFKYLDKCIIINSIGLICYFIVIIKTEFSSDKKIIYYDYKIASKVGDFSLSLFFWLIILLWYIIVLVYNKGLPLFNGGRTFYVDSSISPIYLALNELICIYALYYGFRTVLERKIYLRWFISLFTVLSSANRSTLIFGSLVPVFIVFLYNNARNKVKKEKTIRNKRWIKKTLWKIFFLFGILLLVGLGLQAVRNGGKINFIQSFNELIYGNTFSDIRDGAFLLRGFENKYDKFLKGKTIFSGIISFIPSSISQYRYTWSWGRFSTKDLFGWSGHTGLRGGNVMEWYMNFGFFGAMVAGAVQGFCSGLNEKVFYYIFLNNDIRYVGKEYIVIRTMLSISALFVCSAGAFNIYVDLLFLFGIVFVTKCLKYKVKKIEVKYKGISFIF